MTKFVSYICLLAMLCSSFIVYAEDKIIFDTKVSNPNLTIPVNKATVMKNNTLVIEMEDMEYEKVMVPFDDDAASGGVALKINASGSAKPVKPSIQLDFTATNKGSYNVWLRAYTANDGTNFEVDFTGKGTYTGKTMWFYEKKGTYMWHKIGNQTYEEGKNHIDFRYNAGSCVFDKLIITADTDFTPVEMNDVPVDYNTDGEVNSGNDSSSNDISVGGRDKIKVYPTKGEHPRLFVNSNELSELIEKVHNPVIESSYETIKKQAQTDLDCNLPEDSNLFQSYSNYDDILISRAFMYLIGEADDAHALETIKDMRDFVSTVTYDLSDSTYSSRYIGDTMVAVACVYDWCYDLLTDADKQFFIDRCLDRASVTEVGYPPVKRGLITSHGVEDLIYLHQLAISIAVYDEFPEWYNTVAGLIFEKMAPPKEFLNSSGNTFSSWAYGHSRNNGSVHAEKLFSALGMDVSVSMYGEKYPAFYDMYIYGRLPNGVYFKEGDDYFWNSYRVDNRNTTMGNLYRYVGGTYNLPILQQQGALDLDWGGYRLNPIGIMMSEFDVEMSDPTKLPLTRFTVYPMSTMVARTSWHDGMNAPTAMAYVNMRDITVGDHQHRDLGAFQIYYKGMLAIDSGFYQYGTHFYNYQERSIAHNTMLIDDPNEPPYETYVADGGQKSWRNGAFGNISTYEDILDERKITAVSKAKYAGPDAYKPEFSYISSDISSAYTDKVEAFERSCVFLNLYDEDYPAAFIVYDNLKSKDASFKKTWLLHSEEEPEVDSESNTTVINRTQNGYNGKLVNKTLIPAVGKGTIEKVGGDGKEYYVNGTNFDVNIDKSVQPDAGNWRIELSPKTASEEDKFLNVMYVQDADKDLPELPVYREFGSYYTGATIKDRMVTFSTTRENIASSMRVSVRDNGYEKVKILLTDMQEGKWHITGNGVDLIVESKKDEYCLTFEATPGAYMVAPVNSDVEVTTVNDIPEEAESFGDFYIRKNNNLMYLAKPTKLIDGVPYVAIDGIFTQIGESEIIEKTDTSITIKNYDNTAVITADSNQYTMNGEQYELKYPVKIIDGELYATLEGFEKLLSIKQISYSGYAHLLKFTFVSKAPIEGVDMTKAITPVAMSSTPHDGANELDMIADRDMSTYFCTVGEDCWVEYDLGEVYDVSSVMMAFFRGGTRKTKLKIYVSEDGVTYKEVFNGTSSGKDEKLESFRVNEKARFVKVALNGNDNGVMYNSVYELFVLK